MKDLKSIGLCLFALITMVQSQSSPLNKKCGKSRILQFQGCLPKKTSSRIIGGVNVSTAEIPWQALLIPSHDGRWVGSICGGSIISQDFVLTAGHCLKYPYDTVFSTEHYKAKAEHSNLWVGSTKYDKGKKFKFEQIIIHPGFSWKKTKTDIVLYNDIALVKVDKKFNFNNTNIRAICLPPPNFDVDSGKKVVVSGFGFTSTIANQNIKDTSKVLMRTDLDIVNRSDFKCSLNGTYTPVNNSKICTFKLNHDACSGESGGPVSMKINGKCTVVGIISEGIGCADPRFGGLNTNVAFFVGWISSYLNESYVVNN